MAGTEQGECLGVQPLLYHNGVRLLEVRLGKEPEPDRKAALTSTEKRLWQDVKVRVESPKESPEALTLTLGHEARSRKERELA